MFHRPQALSSDIPGTLIKRVIATAGDSVEGRTGHMWMDGMQFESHTSGPTVDLAVVVPDGHVWAMGDNRRGLARLPPLRVCATDSITGTAVV